MADDGSIISHFSHPGHELVKRHYVGPFRCDMCWEDLSGCQGYGCRAGCDFAIHDTCAGHPQALLSPEHHPHQLVLLQQTRRRDAPRACDVCVGGCAAGCFLYRCPPCGFDMHPRCVRLPRVVRSARHHPARHDLTLVVVRDDEGRRRCAACHHGRHGGARAWYYRCTVCSNLDFHVSCAAAADGGEVNAAAAASRAVHGHAAGPVGAAAGNGGEGELALARIKARRDLNYAIAIANIRASGAAALADLSGDYPTRRF